MRFKLYKLRSLALGQGKSSSIDLDMEFDGDRAFVVWDSITVGDLLLKARVEINPLLLRKGAGRGIDFLYQGELVLPRPENN